MKKIVLVALMALCGVSFSFGVSEKCRVCLMGTNNNMEVCVAACPELNGSTTNSKPQAPSTRPMKNDKTVKGPDGVLYDCNKVDCKEMGLIK